MSRSLFISIGVALSCVLSVIGCKKNIDKEIRDFVASSVVVPYDKFDKRICSHFTDTLSATKDYRLVCYLDSSECQTCRFSQLMNMEKEHINTRVRDKKKLKKFGNLAIILYFYG